MSTDQKEVTGSPSALAFLFSSGYPMQVSGKRTKAQRVARRKAIFGSFTRSLSQVDHPLVTLSRQMNDENDRRTAANKRESDPAKHVPPLLGSASFRKVRRAQTRSLAVVVPSVDQLLAVIANSPAANDRLRARSIARRSGRGWKAVAKRLHFDRTP